MSQAVKRVLLKLSGEGFTENGEPGVSTNRLLDLVKQIAAANKQGIEIGVVVGGGNFLRGSQAANKVLARQTADHMGMLATVMNAIVLRDTLLQVGVDAVVFSALEVKGIAPMFDAYQAKKVLSEKRVAIFAGGTGNPFVSTDSAASLRAIEIGADILLKATKVDGIYDADPAKYPNAKLFEHLTYDQALADQLAVMDLVAFWQCREYCIPIRVFNLFKPGMLLGALQGEPIGTLVTRGES